MNDFNIRPLDTTSALHPSRPCEAVPGSKGPVPTCFTHPDASRFCFFFEHTGWLDPAAIAKHDVLHAEVKIAHSLKDATHFESPRNGALGKEKI